MATGSTGKKVGNTKYIATILGVAIVILVLAAFIGRSDSGAINVNEVIQNSNQANTDSGGDPNNNVNSTPQALRNLPNGGLVPLSESEGIQPSIPEPVSNADESLASTTEEVDENAVSENEGPGPEDETSPEETP